jgi:oligoendopeptidase F
MYSANIQKLERSFVPKDFTVTTWDLLEPFYKELLERPIENKKDLERWLQDSSELESVVSEDSCWRNIKLTCDTKNTELETSYNYFCTDIRPHIEVYNDLLNKKLVALPVLSQLDPQKYATMLRSVRNTIELFRPENVAIQTDIAILEQKYGKIAGAMMVEIQGKEYTLQQASKFLEDPDRAVREEVYKKIGDRRLQDQVALDTLYDELIALRIKLAKNAGFANYYEYRFQELGRFDYKKEDCIAFAEAVKEHVLPLVAEIHTRKKEALQLDTLRPWDLEAEPATLQPLHPFTTADDLLEKSITCLRALHPFFGDCIAKMKEMNHLDLDSRKGKRPGGYNCSLAESGAPFVFMNAAGQLSDVSTMLHEAGHAVHSFLTHGLELNAFKNYSSEIAEVASMSMELLTMDYWHVFLPNPAELKRAKLYHLQDILIILPWIAIIDSFQLWIYEHPQHTHAERQQAWVRILGEFSTNIVDFTDLEQYRSYSWQRQLHLFEWPLYYIEYGIAQLGALGMYMQYKQNTELALQNYCNALSLGATKPLPELFAAAGLEFDFSPATIQGLMQFVQQEIQSLL